MAKRNLSKLIYNPRYLSKHLTPKQARKEYTALRKRAMERSRALQKIFPKAHFLRNTMQKLEPQSAISDEDIYSALSDAAYVLRHKLSTIRGQREVMQENIKTFHEHSFTFVNEENYWDFTDFLDGVKYQIQSMQYDSGRAIDLYEKFTEKGIPADVLKKDFDSYMDNYRKIMAIDEDGMTQKQYLQEVKKIAKQSKKRRK